MWAESGASLCLLICSNALINSRGQTAALARSSLEGREEGRKEGRKAGMKECRKEGRKDTTRRCGHQWRLLVIFAFHSAIKLWNTLTGVTSCSVLLKLWSCWSCCCGHLLAGWGAISLVFISLCWFSPAAARVFVNTAYIEALHFLWSSRGSRTN